MIKLLLFANLNEERNEKDVKILKITHAVITAMPIKRNSESYLQFFFQIRVNYLKFLRFLAIFGNFMAT